MSADLSPTVMPSELDESVNFVVDHPDGKVESRYVRRDGRYFICYLSSHSGCSKGCRFCHLTQTAQTSMTDLTVPEIVAQTEPVLAHYDTTAPAREVHFNFMARGEVFANRHVLDHADELLDELHVRAAARRLFPSVKLSTIFPAELDGRAFTDIFGRHQPDLYYSIYSTDPTFRRRWLPRALPHTDALAVLRDWQVTARKIPVLHWAFIAGENDRDGDVDGIAAAVTDAGLRCDINIVRYNPYSPAQGVEPSEERIAQLASRLRAALPDARVKVVTRVGFDVAASCGMFVGARPGRAAAVPFPTREAAGR